MKNFAYRLFKKTSDGSRARNPSVGLAQTGLTALRMTEEAAVESPFLADIKILCERARREDAAQQAPAGPDRESVLRLLNQALATEIVCVLRYKRHYFMACAMKEKVVADGFLEHVSAEQEHADQIAARIIEIGGEPNFSPEGILGRSHSEYVEGESLIDMIREDLVAELVVIESYREMIAHFGKHDPTSRQMLERIVSAEEAHLGDLAALLEKLGRTKKAANQR